MTAAPSDDYQIIDDNQENDENEFESDSSSECPFNPDIASKLTAAFAKATGIEIEFAVQLLKDHEWNIDLALKATYDAKEHVESIVTTKQDSKGEYFKILSWNTDTADSDEVEINDLIEQQTETMIEILLREKPDIIFLQQVGTIALTLIITSLSSLYDDESIQIDSPTNTNYVSIFTLKSNVEKKNVSTIQNSDNWKMLKVEIEYKSSIHMDLFNAFIEENTYSFCFEQINQNNPNHIVLFGISSQIPDTCWNSKTINLNDLWEKTDQRPEATYTFDPELNSNITEKHEPQRSDRIFFRSPTSMNNQLKPVHMELEGIQRIKTSDILFPSKHWAIQAYFDVEN
ncbi:unnamed protein product [Rotaria magnacalcarata]|uniref:UBA-like domain-containing protein n=2 Tax=Rotaria magnacalcarata TaxID=392030 RepID=A0A815EK45_9BILA|nr:unnamed protein product [Rotaria magnacalcarata]CAF1311094.1 unnamed protein product [Rotaria magnacalcarata]CAF5078013.1 unnamed protein product [Rotaria magnacalcarata]